MPFISIIVPTYNRASLLMRVMQSILSQNYSDFEVIVVDDGSTDNTRHVVRNMDSERIRYVRQENAGAASARNRGVSVSRGEHVAFLDSDDEARPGWLTAVGNAFEEHGADVVCCGHEIVNEEGEREGSALPREYGPAFNCIRGMFYGTIIMRKSVLEAIGGYTEGLPSGQHTELALRLAWHPRMKQWKVHNIMKPLITVHQHSKASIQKNLRARYEGGKHVLEEHARKIRRDPTFFANTCGSIGVTAFRIGERKEARRLFWTSAYADPTSVKRWARIALAYASPLGERVWNRQR